MKVKIESEHAARLFGCEVGDVRDLQRPDAEALVGSKDISAVEGDEPAPAPKKKAPAKKKASA